MTERYRRAGFGGRVGWGKRPALLVIDMANAWTRPDKTFGSDLSGVTDSIVELLAVFRRKELPRYFTTMAYDPDMRELGEVFAKKIPGTRTMVRGTADVELIPELGRQPDETLIEKPRASAFVGTNLTSQLISDGVDTVVVTGCSTSGCIRATCESAIDLNFRVIVPLEAVGDRSSYAHAANLLDIDNRSGDVTPLSDVLKHLG
ncbi:isochorismatase family protein [Rhodococcus wratislaviensis]|uniref:isochorismatase family protein n=1 Tax=Rhodococcus wratislaviensis TaxID=44752 RepID=UPI00351614AE